jgi:hypothetical protein
MKAATIHLDDAGHPIDLHVDDGGGTPISAFLLLTSVPVEPEASHILCYGNSDTVGRMLFNFWRNSVSKDPGGAWVIEKVAQDIVDAANKARGVEWPGDGPTGNA